MKLKVSYRDGVVWNVICAIFFSFGFLFLQDIYYAKSSVLNKTMFFHFLDVNLYALIYSLITLICVLKLKKISSKMYLLVSIYTFGLTLFNFYHGFSKILLVILFLYLIVSYYLYNLYNESLQEAYYNPGYHKNDLFSPMLKDIKCELVQGSDVQIGGVLTNWSKDGCFVKLDENTKLKSNRVLLKCILEGHEFTNAVKVVSKLKRFEGYGLKVLSDSRSNEYNWADFYDIISKRGMNPEMLR